MSRTGLRHFISRPIHSPAPGRTARRTLRVGCLLLGCLLSTGASNTQAPVEDGYELWLRYRPVSNVPRLGEYRTAVTRIVVNGHTPTLLAAREELTRGLAGLLGKNIAVDSVSGSQSAVLIVTPNSAVAEISAATRAQLRLAGTEGFVIRREQVRGKSQIMIAANSDIGALRGTFRFLRLLQTQAPISTLAIVEAPAIELRVLNHWDNLDGSVERGYAGRSLWDWASLPDSLPERYRDYARANASIGINGSVLTNVNANATVLSAAYLQKVRALAEVFRPYGIRVYLTARFSAPIELGGLKTADPLDPAVRTWWKAKIDEIYTAIPDFGGLVVKANSEGQPGPQDYKRSHADGANMMAEALAPHGGVVMWRAFVYSSDVPADRIRQAYDEFKPLDGTFLKNVLVQVKNGPLDFQPREPFHPLFGGMPGTPLMMEFQVTKEYLGQDTHLAYMAPYYEEVLDADTYANGRGSTVARVIDGSVHRYQRTGIAGVANIGNDRNWTGSHFNQANWYAYGRLAWNPQLSSGAIADEWIRQTLTNNATAVSAIRGMMMKSREAVVDYMTPLGLTHIMATGHHYGPGAWANGGRPDWTPSYYHRADSLGIGFDRTPRGSNAVNQYFGPVQSRYASRATVPDNLVLWFHHAGWNEKLHSGRTVWQELVKRYHAGVDSVRSMQKTWNGVTPHIDAVRFAEVKDFLAIQEKEARWWRDASLLYFQTFSKQAFPPGYEKPAHSLDFYQKLRCPPNRDKPRCDVLN
jgi:alpha-glucuronidase